MSKINLLFTVVIFLMTISNIAAQELHTPDKVEKEPGFESIISGLLLHNSESEKFDPAVELHFTYWTSHKWAFGVGYSIIFEDHNELGHELAALVSHKPWPFLTVNFGPSFALANSDENTEVSAYIEGEFKIKLGIFQVGPVVGALVAKEVRPFIGLHGSYEF